ncbi:Succinate--hydroxymethylglutarate CoA-transferase, partial [Tolypocladium ophioglossoides CBS 100239]
FCTQILADYGADVIKIEQPAVGDDTRSWRTTSEQEIWKPGSKETSAYFTTINRNKRSVTLDLKSDRGRSILLKLAKRVDVVIDNFVPGKMEDLKIGYEQLREANPAVIHASISGYGRTGPYAKRAGYDVIAAAEGGLLHITGEPDGRPMKPGVGLTDMCTGLYMHGAILAALRARDATGQGQQVDTSLFEAQVSLLANVAMSWLNGGQEARRWGTEHPSIVPYDCFRTADAFLVAGAVNNRQFGKLCRLLGDEGLAGDERFVDNAARVKNRKALSRILDGLFSQKSTDEWLEVFEGSGMPYGPINSMERVFSHPQTIARDMVQIIKDDSAVSGHIKVLGIPVKFSHHKPSIRSKAPRLGEHTDAVLGEIGVGAQEISQLRRDKVV